MLKAVLFDLDGTLLPMREDEFVPLYVKLLIKKISLHGYEEEKLTKVLWAGNKRIVLNDGMKSNEEVFWEELCSHLGEDFIKEKEYIDSFYTNEFLETKRICKENKLAKEIVKFVKDNNLLCILSTNPVFPRVCTKTRMGFVDLEESDFDYCSYYENSSYSKPNPIYFLEILEKFNLEPEEVILFGNNTYEDGECALKCGIKTYLVGDYIIYHDKAIHYFPVIKMEEVTKTIQKHLDDN